MVALKGVNDEELVGMARWCGEQGFDLTLIETMPMGSVDDDRVDRYPPLTEARAILERVFTLSPDDHRTGGPARYWKIEETGGRLGLITPLTGNFRSEEHTSELQSLMRISYAVFCLKKKTKIIQTTN